MVFPSYVGGLERKSGIIPIFKREKVRSIMLPKVLHHAGFRRNRASSWPLFISALLITCTVAAYFLIPGYQRFLDTAYNVLTSDDRPRISAWVGELGFWGPAFVILAMIIQMFLLVVPSPVLMVVSVLAYGPYWGVVLSVVAVAASATIVTGSAGI